MAILTEWINGGRLDNLLDAIPTTAMRGTDNAALAATALTDVTWTDAKAGYIDTAVSGRAPSSEYDTEMARITANVATEAKQDTAQTELDKVGTIPALDGGAQTIGGAIAKLADDNGGVDFDAGTDSLQEIRDRGDAAWAAGTSNPNLLLEAEIAVVNSQTEFTLASGSDQDNAYDDQAIVLYDDTNSDYPSIRIIEGYVGATKTVTIDSAPDFTLGADDSVKIFVTAPGTTAPTAAAIVNEWETQSQADPTGFHVNVKELNDVVQTGNDIGLDIDDLLSDTKTIKQMIIIFS